VVVCYVISPMHLVASRISGQWWYDPVRWHPVPNNRISERDL